MPRESDPYAHPPRLPEGDDVDVRQVIPGDGPIEIEVGPGRGAFIFERLEAAPDVRLIGLEIRRKWSQIVDERIATRGLGHRARVFCEDAKLALPRLGPEASVRTAFVLFPDPWWKKRHRKRLVIGDVLLRELSRLLEDGGELFIETDVADRAELYAKQVEAYPAFAPAGDEAGDPHMVENPYGARTNREHRAVADGLPVHRLRYRRLPRG